MAQKDDIDLIELWRAILSHRWLLVAIVLVSAVASVAAALTLPKIYEARIVLSPANDDASQGLLSSLSGPLSSLVQSAPLGLGGMASNYEAMAVLKSDAFTSEFIEKHGLIEPLFKDSLKPGDDKPTMGDALELFNEEVRSIGVDSQSGLITMRISWTDRELAAQWANAMVREVNERLRLQAITEAEQSIGFLNAELQKTRVTELKSAIYRSIEAQINAIMIANIKKEFAFKVIDPARIPDKDKSVRPRKKMIVVSSVMLSGIFGIALIFLLTLIKR